MQIRNIRTRASLRRPFLAAKAPFASLCSLGIDGDRLAIIARAAETATTDLKTDITARA